MTPTTSIYQSAGELLIGSRLKRLGERIFSEIGRVYRELDIPFEPAWFPVFFLLDRRGAMPVTSLSRAIGVSSAAASQFVRKLEERGLVLITTGEHDKRVRAVTLTETGRELLQRVRPVWQALSSALAEMEAGRDELRRLLELLTGLENGLNQEALIERVLRRLPASSHSPKENP